jgi:hypothetical protein
VVEPAMSYEPAAEVDSERERYSAKRYIEHLRACEDGDRRGFPEWSRYLLNLAPDDYRVFSGQVDQLMADGALFMVLSPEEQALAASNARAKRDELIADELRRAQSTGPSGLPMELVNRAICDDYQPTQADLMGLPAWPDIEEGDDDEDSEEGPEGQGIEEGESVEFEIEVGGDEGEDAEGR